MTTLTHSQYAATAPAIHGASRCARALRWGPGHLSGGLRLTALLGVTLAGTVTLGCGSGGGSNCVTGAQIACTTFEGRTGVQVCLSDGTFGPCGAVSPASAPPTPTTPQPLAPAPAPAPTVPLAPAARPEPTVSRRRLAEPYTLFLLDDETRVYDWHAPTGPTVRLSVRTRAGTDGYGQVKLRGEWEGTTEVLGTAHLPFSPYVSVTLNERDDGRLVVRFEGSGHSSEPGSARVILFEWDATAHAVRSVGVWDGVDDELTPDWALVSQGPQR